jgi:hypothetical protein
MQRILSVDRLSPVPEIKKVYPYDRRNKYRVKYDQWKGTDPEYCEDPIERSYREADNKINGDTDRHLAHLLFEAFDKENYSESKLSWVDFNNKVRIA